MVGWLPECHQVKQAMSTDDPALTLACRLSRCLFFENQLIRQAKSRLQTVIAGYKRIGGRDGGNRRNWGGVMRSWLPPRKYTE